MTRCEGGEDPSCSRGTFDTESDVAVGKKLLPLEGRRMIHVPAVVAGTRRRCSTDCRTRRFRDRVRPPKIDGWRNPGIRCVLRKWVISGAAKAAWTLIAISERQRIRGILISPASEAVNESIEGTLPRAAEASIFNSAGKRKSGKSAGKKVWQSGAVPHARRQRSNACISLRARITSRYSPQSRAGPARWRARFFRNDEERDEPGRRGKRATADLRDATGTTPPKNRWWKALLLAFCCWHAVYLIISIAPAPPSRGDSRNPVLTSTGSCSRSATMEHV